MKIGNRLIKEFLSGNSYPLESKLLGEKVWCYKERGSVVNCELKQSPLQRDESLVISYFLIPKDDGYVPSEEYAKYFSFSKQFHMNGRPVIVTVSKISQDLQLNGADTIEYEWLDKGTTTKYVYSLDGKWDVDIAKENEGNLRLRAVSKTDIGLIRVAKQLFRGALIALSSFEKKYK